jgi:hypothetical protein
MVGSLGEMRPVASHATDNAGDRRVGELWERRFARLAMERGWAVTAHQIGRKAGAATAITLSSTNDYRQLLMPDLTVWSAKSQHHEIKHKNPTRNGQYGLEQYRLELLLDFAARTGQTVMYTIHDWELAGASGSRQEMPNSIEHWRTVDLSALSKLPHRIDEKGTSYCNGQRTETCIWYWPVEYWVPVSHYWDYGNTVNTSYVVAT